jgi:AdoMet-dependent heme synthase
MTCKRTDISPDRKTRTVPSPFLPTAPVHMVWLATDACQLQCIHCSSDSGQREADELSTSEALDMVDQLARFGVLDLGISGGEPMMRSDIFEIINHADDNGMRVGIGTSGQLLSNKRLDQLAKTPITRLQISLDGFADIHDIIRCRPGLFQRALSALRGAIQRGIIVNVCFTVNRLNVDQLSEFTEFIADQGIHRLNISRYVPTGRGDDMLDLPDFEWPAIIRQCHALSKQYSNRLTIVSHLAQEILMDPELGQNPMFSGCQAGRGQGCITANGTVLPCVLLPVPVGNIRNKPFHEIWRNAPDLLRLRDRSHLEGPCRTCRVRERCGGCRAVAMAKTGELLSSDPRCWNTQY